MAKTFGVAGAPSQLTINLDALLATSLANYRKTLEDNISAANVIWSESKRNGTYQSVDGGQRIEEPLMYALGNADTYDSYDPLSTDPTDGITNSVWEWRQAAVPITISFKEERQNAHRIVDLLKAKIKQAEMGMQEFIPKMMMFGAKAKGGAGSIVSPYTSSFNGSLGIEPLASLIRKDPTASVEVGNINQSTSAWWRNRTKESAASTTTAFLQEVENLYNTCSLGAGGSPNLIITDQQTYEILKFALYHRTRHEVESDPNFPFENIKFRRARVIWDEFVPDVESDAANTDTYGTMFMINSKFLHIKYDRMGNFRNTKFKTPDNQDAKVAHILWMGNTTISNRRKHGVLYKIARTSGFTIS